ncbi:MAG: hypothetical protein NVSMB14_16450 [Isosphaeraceae bacterium]
MGERAGENAIGVIVLADDDDDLRAVYAEFLRASGFQVVEAEDGLKTLDRVREVRPHLLVLDLWMPGLNGLEVLERLRHEPVSNRMKVIMLSNVGEADVRLEAFEGGAISYMVKGIALENVLEHVRVALATHLAVLIDPD